MGEPWRDLRVGDRIRIVRIPSPDVLGFDLRRNTKQFYKRLITLRRIVTVNEIDQWGVPWIQCRIRGDTGKLEYHFLAINDDSWVRVKPCK